MPSEASKSIARRLRDPLFTTRVFAGAVLDVGGGYDSLEQWQSLFPRVTSVRTWDLPDGDAQYLTGVEDCSFDTVHSSHCLEHMVDPLIALDNWWRVLKVGGFLAVVIPDEDLYEQGMFPSTFNADHKWTFTLYKRETWSPRSISVLTFAARLPNCRPLRFTLLDDLLPLRAAAVRPDEHDCDGERHRVRVSEVVPTGGAVVIHSPPHGG